MKLSMNDHGGLVVNISGTNEGMKIVFTEAQTSKIKDFILATFSEDRLKSELDRRFQIRERELQAEHDAEMNARAEIDADIAAAESDGQAQAEAEAAAEAEAQAMADAEADVYHEDNEGRCDNGANIVF